MKILSRENPKTKLKEYKARYYFMKDGKKRDSMTGWFSTISEAENEAIKLKKAKEDEDANVALQRRDKLLTTAFNEFIDEYEKLSTRHTTDNTTTDCSIWRRAKTIREKYIPKSLKNVATKDIDATTFRDWLQYINGKDISGNYIRSLKSTLGVFNKWLRDNGYYATRNLDIDIDYALSRTKIQNKRYKNRVDLGERNIISILEIEKICNYFYEKGIEIFQNFYYYTLFYLMFFSGMRVEEIVGLQWKFINFKSNTIEIKNAISEREIRENVYERINSQIYRTKNETSNRIIQMFSFYYDLLLDYKSSYKYYFNLSKDELEECFVFPKLQKKNPHDYQAGDRMNYMLHQAIKELGIKNTDCQMMRHSCAMFLISPSPNGLAYKEEEIIEYFGHTDTEMIKTVYARLNKYEKSKRMKQTFEKYINKITTLQQTEEDNAQIRLIERFKDNTKVATEKRKDRTFKQIEYAIKNCQKNYYYMPKDKEIIDEYILKHKVRATNITFIEEDI